MCIRGATMTDDGTKPLSYGKWRWRLIKEDENSMDWRGGTLYVG